MAPTALLPATLWSSTPTHPSPTPYPQKPHHHIHTQQLQLEAAQLIQHASALYLTGDLESALSCYNHARSLGPSGNAEFEACMGAGCVLRELGRIERAAVQFANAVQLRPQCSVARANFASSCYERGHHGQAIQEFRIAIALNPMFPDAYNNMGNALRALGKTREAEDCYRAALHFAPTHPHALNNLGNALRGRGAAGEAAALYIASLRSQPGFAAAHCNFGGLLRDQGKANVAEVHYRAALRSDPLMAEAAAGLATALRDMGRTEEAVKYYRDATKLQPVAADHHANLANTYKDLGKVQESIVSYQRALELKPDLPDSFCNMVHSLAFICDWRKRKVHLQLLRRIIDKQLQVLLPGYDHQVENAGQKRARGGHGQNRRYSDSTSSSGGDANVIGHYYPHMYGSFHNSTPNAVNTSPKGQMRPLQQYSGTLSTGFSFSSTTNSRQTTLDITQAEAAANALVASSATFGVMPSLPSVQPFHALIYPLSPEKFRALSITYAMRAAATVSGMPLATQRYVRPNPRLKIGYVSSDFANHPFAHLTQSIYGLHRGNSTVEVFCYALTASDNSEWRKIIEGTAEHFTDISKMPTAQAAQTIANDGIHVLINCNGYTKGARTELFALRPAPVQVSFMGFPGPLGASYIEYFVTDLVTSPPDLAHRVHTEALLYHPHTYFVNDHHRSSPPGPRAFPGGPLTRGRYGLPENCFLFCNFNQLYKLDPDTFDVWATILHRVPDSKLWLLRFPGAAEERIREEAARRHLSPDRIIFTDVAAKKEHVARCGLADLFLDTPTCNAHTTGTDALWSGLPLITCPGELFASRVAASLLTAANLPELICPNMVAYADLAVELARNPARLSSIRRRLESGRSTAPLFDTERWVRNLEGMLWDAWRIRDRGEAPRNIVGEDVGSQHDRFFQTTSNYVSTSNGMGSGADQSMVNYSVYQTGVPPIVQRGVPLMTNSARYIQETIR